VTLVRNILAQGKKHGSLTVNVSWLLRAEELHALQWFGFDGVESLEKSSPTSGPVPLRARPR
jgi:hypothetical protein